MHKCVHIKLGILLCVHILKVVVCYKRGDVMAYTKEGYEAAKKYKSEKIKRVPLDMQKEDYDVLKATADGMGEKVNEFIKKAIKERLDRTVVTRVDKTTE